MEEIDIHNAVYNPEDIQRILKLGKNKVYEFLEDVLKNTHYFKIIKIGRLYKIPKSSFDKWLCEDEIRRE